MTDAAPPESAASLEATDSTKPRRNSPRVWPWLLGLLVVLVLAAAGSWFYWYPALQPFLPAHQTTSVVPISPPPDALAARLTAIERKLDALSSLDTKLGAVEQRPSPDNSASVAALTDQVQQLNARLDQVEARLAQLIKDQSARGDSAQRVLMVALGDLGNAIASSQPFAAQLASAEALGQGRPGWANALRPLEDVAKTGIPSTAVLAQHFSDEVAPAILRADAASPNPQESIGEAVLSRLRSLVVIRRVDGQGRVESGTSAQTAVAVADAALGKGDLAGAVAALSNLSGAPDAAASSWRQQAQQRLDAEHSIASLMQDLSADIAAGAGGG